LYAGTVQEQDVSGTLKIPEAAFGELDEVTVSLIFIKDHLQVGAFGSEAGSKTTRLSVDWTFMGSEFEGLWVQNAYIPRSSWLENETDGTARTPKLLSIVILCGYLGAW
jgi:hypothetical protein